MGCPCISVDPDLVKLAAAISTDTTSPIGMARSSAAAEALVPGWFTRKTSNTTKCIKRFASKIHFATCAVAMRQLVFARGLLQKRRGRNRGARMAILVDKATKVICQGITGRRARSTRSRPRVRDENGGRRDAGQGRQKHPNEVAMPIFDTVLEAKQKTGADATIIYVPPPFAADAIMEAADAGMQLIVCITEGIPVLDMVKVKRALEGPSRA